jgi:polysaccharide biosynthesis protein PslH
LICVAWRKWAQADIVTGITSVDHEYYVHLKGPDRAFLLPYGYQVTENDVSADQNREEPSDICFIGSMDWPPNIVAAGHLAREIMPLIWNVIPDMKCFIVGKNPSKEVRALASEKVIVTGTVPSVREYYDRAVVVVVPVQEGSGVKIKLIEAMAFGKAVVTTSTGAAGINIEDGVQVRVANHPQKFADSVIDLVRDRAKRERLGKEARRFVVDHLSPKETEMQLEKILQALNQL